MASTASSNNPAGSPGSGSESSTAPVTATVPIVLASSGQQKADPTAVPGLVNLPVQSQPAVVVDVRSAEAGQDAVATGLDAARAAQVPAAVDPQQSSAAAAEAPIVSGSDSSDEVPWDPAHPASWVTTTIPATASPSSMADSAQPGPWAPVTGAWDLPDMPDWQQRRHAGLAPGPDSGMIPTCFSRSIDSEVDNVTVGTTNQTNSGTDMPQRDVNKPSFAALIGGDSSPVIPAAATEPLNQIPAPTAPPGGIGSVPPSQQGRLPGARRPASRSVRPTSKPPLVPTGEPSDVRTDSFERVLATPIPERKQHSGNLIVAAALACTVVAGVGMWHFLETHKSKPASVAVTKQNKTQPKKTTGLVASPGLPKPSVMPTTSSKVDTSTPSAAPVAPSATGKATNKKVPKKPLKPIAIVPKKMVTKPAVPVDNGAKTKPKNDSKPVAEEKPTPIVTKPVLPNPKVSLPAQGGSVTFAKGPFADKSVATVMVIPSPGLTLGENPGCIKKATGLECKAPELTADKRLKLEVSVAAVKPGNHSITFSAIGTDGAAIDSQVTQVVSTAPVQEKPEDKPEEKPTPEQPGGEKPADPNGETPGSPVDGQPGGEKPTTPEMPAEPEGETPQQGNPQEGQPDEVMPDAKAPQQPAAG